MMAPVTTLNPTDKMPKVTHPAGMPKDRAVYWAIKGGHQWRTTWEKYSDPRYAARECFGMSTTNMLAVNCGSTLGSLRRMLKELDKYEEGK